MIIKHINQEKQKGKMGLLLTFIRIKGLFEFLKGTEGEPHMRDYHCAKRINPSPANSDYQPAALLL